MTKQMIKSSILTAIISASALTSVSNAVNINEDGIGQVLVYPYYTVNNDLDSLMSVVNTTDEVKAVKVRFLEGKNGREVLTFNLYLSPFDVWTAALTDITSVPQFSTESGVGVGIDFGGQESAKIITTDTSCTVPEISGQQFLPFAFSGDFDDGLDQHMSRVREGHIEIIEMGTIINDDATAATHIAGVPEDCSQLIANWTPPTGQWILDSDVNVAAPNGLGGLHGSVSLIDVAEGVAFTYDADAFEAYSTDRQHAHPGDLFPNLATGNSMQSNIIYAGTPVTSNWLTSPVEAVSASYMRQNIYADYTLDGSINARTELVVTLPTKSFYVDPLNAISLAPVEPFTTMIGTDLGGGIQEACEQFVIAGLYDREETTPEPPSVPPPVLPPFRPIPELCWSANVLEFEYEVPSFGSTEILGSTNDYDLITPYVNGWINLRFNQRTDNNVSDTDGTIQYYNGLPVTGFVLQKYTNTAAQPGLLAQYGGTFKQKGHRVIFSLD